jgi:hypothetical protein
MPKKPGVIVCSPPETEHQAPGLPIPLSKPPTGPTPENARLLLIKAIELGTLVHSPHFTDRCEFREFSAIDAETCIESGKIIGGPREDEEHRSWKYDFWTKIDGKGWKLVVALDWDIDLERCPQATYVSVHRLNAKRVKRVYTKGTPDRKEPTP